MGPSEEVQCYNKGCGQKFNPSDNKSDSCEHHPGEPVFHDADKLWSCCNKRSKDFTEFLSMPGCTRATHNPVKPALPPKYTPSKDDVPSTRSPAASKQQRPLFDAEMTTLEPTVSSSLIKLLVKEREETTEDSDEEVDPTTGIRIGEPCKRNACKMEYEGPASSLELCKYHPGGPVFHEGLKFWACCNRRTTDFTEFLAQPGCTTDKHIWTDDKSVSQRTECRYDWHQTENDVTVTVYAKGALQHLTSFAVNPVRLTANIRHAGDLQFNIDLELQGIIDTSECSVQLTATKVEIKMKKAELVKWSQLHVPTKQDNSDDSTTAAALEDDDGEPDIDLCAVDLSGL